MAHRHNSNTSDREPSWAGVDKAALPRVAFADKGEPEKKSTWKYPHHFVSGGTRKDENGIWTDGEIYLHRGGLNAAWSAAQGGRSGQQASSSVKSHLDTHRKALKIGEHAEEPKSSDSSILDLVQDRAWAIHPAKLDEINAFVMARANGQVQDIEAAKGKSGNRATEAYEVVDGVAVIPVYGTLGKRMNMLMAFSGGTSTELIQRDIAMALDDPAVTSILLDIDSPGGTIDGTKELSDYILEAKLTKPIVAYANGMMASAAAWIGTSATEVVAFDTAITGSIGVAVTHYDRSERDKQQGVTRTEIYAGKYKRIAPDSGPLTKEGKAYLQDMVDTYYSIFVEAMARNRNTTVDAVLEHMADGRLFIGRQALDVGLVDQVGNMSVALKSARQKGRNANMDREMLKQDHPEVYAEIETEVMEKLVWEDVKTRFAGDLQAELETARSGGVEDERGRCVGLLDAQADPEATRAAISDGTPVADAYKGFYEAERQSRTKLLADTQISMEPQVLAQGRAKDSDTADFMGMVQAYQAEHKCGLGTAVKKVSAAHPEIHQAWLDKQAQ